MTFLYELWSSLYFTFENQDGYFFLQGMWKSLYFMWLSGSRISYIKNGSLCISMLCHLSHQWTWMILKASRANTEKKDPLIIRDWNVKSGSQEISGVTDKFSLEVQNEARQRLAEVWQIEWVQMKTVTDLIFLGSKITGYSDSSHEIKRPFLLGRKAMINLDNVFKAEPSLCQQKSI